MTLLSSRHLRCWFCMVWIALTLSSNAVLGSAASSTTKKRQSPRTRGFVSSSSSLNKTNTNTYNDDDDDDDSCDSVLGKIDALPSTDAIIDYIKFELEKVKDFAKLFRCLGGPVQRLPTDLIASSSSSSSSTTTKTPPDYIFGKGSIAHYSNIRTSDQFVSWFIKYFWAGKIFKTSTIKSSTSGTSMNTMWNVLPFSHLTTVTGLVYNMPSIVDDKDCMIIDYRTVNTKIGKRLRDDMREVYWKPNNNNGGNNNNSSNITKIPTQIYIGKVYAFNGRPKEINNDTIWVQPTKWEFVMNFMLDFRNETQTLIPSWTVRKDCCS